MAPSLELSEGPALSKAALKLLARLYKGAWYTETAGKVPAAMAELEAAGLVTKTGRVAVMKSAYVPVGTRDFEQEKFPEMPRWLREKLKESA